MPVPSPSFLERWQPSVAAERANLQPFLNDLCDFLDVPPPAPKNLSTPTYLRSADFHNTKRPALLNRPARELPDLTVYLYPQLQAR